MSLTTLTARDKTALVLLTTVYLTAIAVSHVYFADTGAVDGLIAVGCLALGLAARRRYHVAPTSAKGSTPSPDQQSSFGSSVGRVQQSGSCFSFRFEGGPYIQKVLGAAQAGDWQAAEAALVDLTVVGGYDAAERLLSTMIANGCQPSVRCFNAVIHACARQGCADDVVHLLEEMVAQGAAPDESTFSPVIDVLARMGDIEGAFRWLGLMRSSCVRLDDVQFHKTLKCVADRGQEDLAKAQQLLEDMHEDARGRLPCHSGWPDGPRRGSAEYNALVQSRAKAGKPRCAEYWLRQALSSGHVISDASYSCVASAFDEAGLLAEAGLWCKMGNLASRVSSRSARVGGSCQFGVARRAT
jgi:pentatricopeptide repeat protein